MQYLGTKVVRFHQTYEIWLKTFNIQSNQDFVVIYSSAI